MNNKVVHQASTLAALVAFICVILMGFVFGSPDPGVSLQPSYPPVSPAEFTRIVNTYPDVSLRVFTADSLFVLSYLVVFAGLYATVADRARLLAVVGLGAGILTALFDATENAYFISYAHQVLDGAPIADPDLPAIYVIANLKWMAAFATLAAFGLAWPRSNRLGWIMSALMLSFVLVGVLGVALPDLFLVRGLMFLIGMPLFAWHFWQRARGA
jgi:hypothetical protein